MLHIRPEQFDALQRAAEERFERWLVRHVRKHFPECVTAFDDEELRIALLKQIERARSFGIQTSPNITRYVNLAMKLGNDFPDDPRIPWAGELLRDATLTEEQKLGAIKRLLDDRALAMLQRGGNGS